MSRTTETDIAIRRGAARLRWAVIAAIALMFGLYLASRLGPSVGGIHIVHRQSASSSPLIGDVGIALLVVALVRLVQMLGAIAAGELFSATVVRRFRGFAFWLMLMALTGLLGPIVAEFVSRQDVPIGQVQIILDFRQILTVGVTLLLFLLARLLERARDYEAESREFV